MADRDAVWPLARKFATTYQVDEAVFAIAFDALVSDSAALVLVAEVPSGQVVGYLLAHCHSTLFANGPVAWVEEVMVDPGMRGHGVGRALMDRAEHWARSSAAAYISPATRRAAAFYAVLGYE